MDIKKDLKKIPPSPGVYLFLDKNKKVLYVGKAVNLKKRVASYFRKTYQPPKTRALVSRIRDLDYVETASSTEALIYEARLIKEKRPKYNIELKDDKSYPYLEFTVKDKFPRIFITREKKKKGSLYYGPYTDAKLLKNALSMILEIFPLRTCKNLPKKNCLKAHIKKCTAPCNGSITSGEYKRIVYEVKLFLEGKKVDLLKKLSCDMKKASTDKDYEKAINLRDRIEAISAVWQGRKPPPPLNKEIESLKEVLGLTILPVRIEAFDISNIHGKESVGSMVSFFSGRPQRDEYRRFRIKEVKGVDDYAMIKEVVKRRYSRVLREKKQFPDLILIDGGKGHLCSAVSELKKTGITHIPVISLAKGDETIYVEKKSTPIKLASRIPALRLLMRIRDEAHRFAISYHKLLRRKSFFGNENVKRKPKRSQGRF